MSDILIALVDGGGNVAPTLLVAGRLAARGHRVRVMADDVIRPEAEAAGAAFVRWTRAPNKGARSRETDAPDWRAPTPLTALALIAEHFMGGTALAFAQDLAEELDRDRADLVITLDMLLGAMVACEARGQPFALLNTYISTFPQPGVPPFCSGLGPRDSDRHVEAALQTRAALDAGLPALNAARAAFDLPPLTHLEDQAKAAEVLWLATARAFDFAPASLPPALRYVGPLLVDPPWAEPWASPWPDSDARPLVLGAFSTSFQDHAGVLQRLIDAAAGLPVRLLVTLGGAIRPDELAPAGNCVLAASAPHSQVMAQTALVVTHGGHGTVMSALDRRLPMLVIPHGRDQDDNAVRVAERGAGLSLPKSASSAQIRQALRRLLDEPAFGEGARRLGDAVAQEAASSTLIEQIEALAVAPVPLERTAAAP